MAQRMITLTQSGPVPPVAPVRTGSMVGMKKGRVLPALAYVWSPPGWRLVIQSLPVVSSSVVVVTSVVVPSVRGSGLVDRLVARGCVYGAHVDRAAHLIELKLDVLTSEAEHVYRVLGVAGVGHPLHAHALVGVIACLGDIEGLPHVPAFSHLLGLLRYIPTAEEVFLLVAEEVPVEVFAELVEEVLVEVTVEEEAEVLIEVPIVVELLVEVLVEV